MCLPHPSTQAHTRRLHTCAHSHPHACSLASFTHTCAYLHPHRLTQVQVHTYSARHTLTTHRYPPSPFCPWRLTRGMSGGSWENPQSPRHGDPPPYHHPGKPGRTSEGAEERLPKGRGSCHLLDAAGTDLWSWALTGFSPQPCGSERCRGPWLEG